MLLLGVTTGSSMDKVLPLVKMVHLCMSELQMLNVSENASALLSALKAAHGHPKLKAYLIFSFLSANRLFAEAAAGNHAVAWECSRLCILAGANMQCSWQHGYHCIQHAVGGTEVLGMQAVRFPWDCTLSCTIFGFVP